MGPDRTDDPPATGRRGIAVALVGAAMAVGVGIGVVAGVPVATGAQDDPTTTTAVGAPGEPAARGGPPPWAGGHGRGHGVGHGATLEAAAKAIGISVDDLRAALRDGKSIAEVAEDEGASRQAVVDAMVAAAERELDEARAALPERIGEIVDAKRPAGGPGPRDEGPGGKGPGGPGHGPGNPGGPSRGRPHLEPAATAIGISVDDLRAALRDGKSIAEVAVAEGSTRQAVVDALVAAARDRIEQAVEAGKLDRERADAALRGVEDRVGRMVDAKRQPSPDDDEPDPED